MNSGIRGGRRDASEWVRREVEIALNDEIYGKRVKVLPLLYKPCQLPGFLAGKLYADFSADFEAGLTKLLAKLNADITGTQGSIVLRGLLDRFQTWAAFGHRPEDLLAEEILEQALDSISPSDVSVDMLEFLLSSMSKVIHPSTPIKSQWIRWINAVPHSTVIASLKRVFESGISSLQTGAAKISGLVQANTIPIMQESLILE